MSTSKPELQQKNISAIINSISLSYVDIFNPAVICSKNVLVTFKLSYEHVTSECSLKIQSVQYFIVLLMFRMFSEPLKQVIIFKKC